MGRYGPPSALPLPMRPTSIKPRSGFSMIELLVVFVVFGLVVMMSIRSVGDTLRRDKASKAASILGADIEQAFAIAARQRTPVLLVLDRANRKISIIDRGATTKIYRQRSFSRTGDYGVDSISANRDTIVIMPNGIATNAWDLTLRDSSTNGTVYTKKVSASVGGMVRINNR
jgi:prepilin-type N-terminal cleavage/methylation domain-containing protein